MKALSNETVADTTESHVPVVVDFAMEDSYQKASAKDSFRVVEDPQMALETSLVLLRRLSRTSPTTSRKIAKSTLNYNSESEEDVIFFGANNRVSHCGTSEAGKNTGNEWTFLHAYTKKQRASSCRKVCMAESCINVAVARWVKSKNERTNFVLDASMVDREGAPGRSVPLADCSTTKAPA